MIHGCDGRGLFLDITPNGSMSWVFRYRLNGKQEKIKIGPYPELELKKARENETIGRQCRERNVTR